MAVCSVARTVGHISAQTKLEPLHAWVYKKKHAAASFTKSSAGLLNGATNNLHCSRKSPVILCASCRAHRNPSVSHDTRFSTPSQTYRKCAVTCFLSSRFVFLAAEPRDFKRTSKTSKNVICCHCRARF